MSGQGEVSIRMDCTRAFTTNAERRNAAAQLYPSGQSEVTIVIGSLLRTEVKGYLPLNIAFRDKVI